MRTLKKIPLLLIPPMLAVLSFGCSSTQGPLQIVLPQDFPEQQPHSAASEKRFQQPVEGATALESAMEISEKYTQLAEEAAVLRQNNKNLAAENKQIREQID